MFYFLAVLKKSVRFKGGRTAQSWDRLFQSCFCSCGWVQVLLNSGYVRYRCVRADSQHFIISVTSVLLTVPQLCPTTTRGLSTSPPAPTHTMVHRENQSFYYRHTWAAGATLPLLIHLCYLSYSQQGSFQHQSFQWTHFSIRPKQEVDQLLLRDCTR